VPDLSDKRVLLLGAETDLGRDVAAALSKAGARLALVGSSSDSETAFAVQRLARKLNAEVSQAIDATNEMAVRVMVRQVSKGLSGLDAVVCTRGEATTVDVLRRFAQREFTRSRVEGVLVVASPEAIADDLLSALAAPTHNG
jgi:NAD(P)-dependent dehydrogenase (short-subunit alcohol dehydrogenase family)